jgi:hypothetical protein
MSRIKHLLHSRTDLRGILNLLEATDAAVTELGSTLAALAKAIDEIADLHDDFLAHATATSAPTQSEASLDEYF